MKRFLAAVVLALLFGFIPQSVQAHEVYVLNAQQIQNDLLVHYLNVFSPLSSLDNIIWFMIFALIAIVTLLLSFRVSFSNWGKSVAEKISQFKPFASPFIRIVLGIALLSSAYHASLFGPELPLAQLIGGEAWIPFLYFSGLLLILGLFTRIVALLLILLFCFSVFSFQMYMLTYINYLAEMVVLLILGGERFSVDGLLFKGFNFLSFNKFHKLAIPLLRISFGIALLYAAIYVKFLHPAISYQVVMNYHLTHFFPFDPLFVVLGAGCVEVVIALLFIIGVNMRWNILFFLMWVTLSLLYFGEAVWPHFILYGISIGLFILGYDQFSLEGWLRKRFKL